MAPTAALPTLTAAPGFPHYLEKIRRFPMLERISTPSLSFSPAMKRSASDA